MAHVRFNHMELSFPRGTLTEEFRADVDSVFADLLGWRASATSATSEPRPTTGCASSSTTT